MKKCSKCLKEKSISEFYSSKVKVSSYCRECVIKNSAERNNRERKIEFSNVWYRRKYNALKERAGKRGIEFELTFEEFKILRETKKCFYCLEVIKEFSVDRVINTIGYKRSNCVSSCYRCNIQKNDLSLDKIKLLKRKIEQFIRENQL